jgi:uncharacterized phage-like protein YoqJ
MNVHIHTGGTIMIITFFGHANYSSNAEDELRLFQLLEEIIQEKQVNFYLGGYGKFDYFALQCAKKYKNLHSNTTLTFITPYLGKWLNERKDLLQSTYDTMIYPEIEHTPQKFAILKRNEWMVNQADYIIFYVNQHYGGAYKTMLYAHKNKKTFINLYKGNYDLY